MYIGNIVYQSHVLCAVGWCEAENMQLPMYPPGILKNLSLLDAVPNRQPPLAHHFADQQRPNAGTNIMTGCGYWSGVAIGGVAGWKGTVKIPEGGDISFRNILHPKAPIALAPSGADAILHCNSFDVKYRPDGSEEQFVSDLSVWDTDGHELERKEIKVNSPLRFRVSFRGRTRDQLLSTGPAGPSSDVAVFTTSCHP